MTTLAEKKSRLREIDRNSEGLKKGKRANEDGCDCDCAECMDDNCEGCLMGDCAELACRSAGCPTQAVRLDQMDAEVNSIRRRRRFLGMRYDPDTVLMAMRQKRHSMGSGARRGDTRSLSFEYRASLNGQPERRSWVQDLNQCRRAEDCRIRGRVRLLVAADETPESINQ